MSAAAPSADLALPLTQRESQIMHAIGRGLTAKRVAGELGISKRTVDQYLTKVREKLEIGPGRTALAIWYARNYPHMLSIRTIDTPLTPLQADAHQLLETIQGLMHGDARARAMARILLERHAKELQQR